MAKQTFTTGQVLTAAQMTSLQQTAMGGGSATAQTTSYVLVAADAGTTVLMNSGSSTTITVNTGLFAAGDTVLIVNQGAGVCTVTAGTATVSTAGSTALSQYETAILYFLSASAAILTDYTQSSGMTNPMTTTGDTIYSSSGSTPARLGIGTTGQVLTVSSGLPAWSTPSSGAMTLLSTTTLSGTTTSISSISGSYTDLVLDFYAITNSSNTDYNINPNGSTTITDVIRGGTTLQQLNDGQLRILNNIAGPLSSSTNNSCRLIIANYAATTNGGKPFDLYGGFIGSDSSAQINHVRGRIKTSSAITSLDFVAGAAFTAGTVKLYGVK